MKFQELLSTAQDNDTNADQLAQLECVSEKNPELLISEFERIHLSELEDEDDAINFCRYGLAEIDLVEFFELGKEWEEFRS